MSLVELPSNDGKIIAVNPHHVSAVQSYSGYCQGQEGKKEMSVVWVNGHNLYVCIWPVEQTLDVLNGARNADALVFEAGWAAALEVVNWVEPVPPPGSVRAAFMKYLEVPE